MHDDLPRSSQQNRLFHSMCQDLAEQVEWAGAKIDKEEWKRLVLAAHYGQRVVPNPFGGGFVVMNNKRSRDLSRTGDDGMSDLLTQLFAFGAERGVKWSDGGWEDSCAVRKSSGPPAIEMICGTCNGCGWCKGSPPFPCRDCGGNGVIEAARNGGAT